MSNRLLNRQADAGENTAPGVSLQDIWATMKRVAILTAAVLLFLLCAAETSFAQESAEAFFEKRVRPVLIGHCLDCHSMDLAESELQLDSLAGLLKGGQRGPAIVPGKPEESLLIRAVRHGELLKMPAKKKLPATEIAALAKWVKDGAVWPNSKPLTKSVATEPAGPVSFSAEQKSFWAFQKPRRASLPDVENPRWVSTPVDWFILARLQAAGYAPARKADHRTLLRRACFALTGLAPTPQQMAAFLDDDSPDAYETAVDRLLNSPAYGERWGRHWLDVVRYADSNGLDENLAHANAFRYRDYVIASLNEDKPFDLFVQEQIAGDQLAFPGEPEAAVLARLPSTGFLSIGPKMLAEDDPIKMQMDIIDEQIDTVGRAFLGLTFGCARCHDHKFDPIPTADYCSLAGIFKSTRTMDTLTVVAKWHERPMATPEAIAAQKTYQKKIDEQAAKITATRDAAAKTVRDEAISQVGDYLLAAETRRRQRKWLQKASVFGKWKAEDRPESALLIEAESFMRGNVARDTTNYGAGIGIIANATQPLSFVEYDLELKSAGRFQIESRYAAAAARPIRLIVNGKEILADLSDRVTGTWFPDTQRWEVEGLVPLKKGRNVVRLETKTYFPHIDKLLLVLTDEEALPQLDPLVPGRNVVSAFVDQWTEFLNAEKPAEPELAERWNRIASRNDVKPLREFALLLESLVTKTESTEAVKGESDGTLEPFRNFILSDSGPFRVPDSIEGEFTEETRKTLVALREERSKLEKAMPQLPSVMAVEDGRIEDVRIHYRGSHLTQGAVIPRRFLRIISGEDQPAIPDGRSGRLEFARWLTSKNNPLTARVFVNRVWQWHFGAGLVRTPDNFGRLGERPTHPELLDWLAVEFMESGWSLKKLHKLILLSSTWQQSIYPAALESPKSILETDPENRLWGRMGRRRLSAEEIRDGILQLSGNLELSMEGSMLPIANRAYVTSTASVNPDVYRSDRRSVYLPVVRSALYEVFQAFDFADPSVLTGKRQSTTVAPQALFMMNSEFVSKQTRQLAEKLLADESADSKRLQNLWLRSYGRSIEPAEEAGARSFLSVYESRWKAARSDAAADAALRAWQSLCRAVISSNEFLYVE